MAAASADPASLGNLHDIVVPLAVSWWPLAPGWYAVVAVLVVLLGWAAQRTAVRHRRNAYRREARRAIAALRANAREPANVQRAVLDLAVLLRRVALTAYPRTRVAPLTGAEWLRFLDDTGATEAFSGAPGACLTTAVYGRAGRGANPLPPEPLGELFDAAEAWVRSHRVDLP